MITERDLIKLGFSKHHMTGSGVITGSGEIISTSINPAQYWYKNDRISINATMFWTWFLDGKQRNDISVSSIESLKDLLSKYNVKLGNLIKMKFDFPLDNEIFRVIGLREKELEVEGDFSAGTHNVCQSCWYKKELIKEIIQ